MRLNPLLGALYALCALLAASIGPAPDAAAIELVEGDVVLIETANEAVSIEILDASGASKGSCPCTQCDPSSIDLAVSPVGTVYVLGTGFVSPFAVPAVFEVDPGLCDERVVSARLGAFEFAGIAVEDDGTILVADTSCGAGSECEAGGVFRIDPTSGAQTLLYTGAPAFRPFALDVASDGRIYALARTDLLFAGIGVFVIDPTADPVSATLVTEGGDLASEWIARDIAIEDSAGPVYVLATQNTNPGIAGQLIEVALGGTPPANQASLTRGLELPIAPLLLGGQRDFLTTRGLAIRSGALLTIDQPGGFGSAGVIRFRPGIDDGETSRGTALGDVGFFSPRGLDVVTLPEPTALEPSLLLLLALGRWRPSRRRPRERGSSWARGIQPGDSGTAPAAQAASKNDARLPTGTASG